VLELSDNAVGASSPLTALSPMAQVRATCQRRLDGEEVLRFTISDIAK